MFTLGAQGCSSTQFGPVSQDRLTDFWAVGSMPWYDGVWYQAAVRNSELGWDPQFDDRFIRMPNLVIQLANLSASDFSGICEGNCFRPASETVDNSQQVLGVWEETHNVHMNVVINDTEEL